MTLKPKTLLYRDVLAAVEQRIVDALPEIVDGLIARAKELSLTNIAFSSYVSRG